MDINASYFTLVSSTLAVQTIVLVPFFLYSLFFPPCAVEVEFPPPAECSVKETKKVYIPNYPSCLEYLFLIAVYLLDIIFLYPFTRAGSEIANWISSLVSLVVLFLQMSLAIGWGGTDASWLAAEKKLGLWSNKAWSCYYMDFISTSVAIGVPLGYEVSWMVVRFVVGVTPSVWMALCQAYAPFKL